MLNNLPKEYSLVLMGDTVDRWKNKLDGEDAALLQRLRTISRQHRVIWLRGNHDTRYELNNPEEIEICDAAVVNGTIHLSHGHYFDNMMPRHRLFVQMVRHLHHLRIKLGAESIHVAQYAKKLRLLYHAFLSHVRDNAIEHAKENGYRIIACGHTHQAEDINVDGIRYVNTGSWTEPGGSRCLLLEENGNAAPLTFMESVQ